MNSKTTFGVLFLIISPIGFILSFIYFGKFVLLSDPIMMGECILSVTLSAVSLCIGLFKCEIIVSEAEFNINNMEKQ